MWKGLPSSCIQNCIHIPTETQMDHTNTPKIKDKYLAIFMNEKYFENSTGS